MGTPFIRLLEPFQGNRPGYISGAATDKEPRSEDPIFVQAMEVRTAVFVNEQNVPADHEYDRDDNRSAHWVTYASVNMTVEPEIRDADGNITQVRRSSTRTVPIGTLRCVPFPHEPHPVPNGDYRDGKLVGHIAPDGTVTPAVLTGTYGSWDAPEQVAGGEASVGKPLVPQPPCRPTSLHNGQEPYVKLGKLAVIKEFRPFRIRSLLVTEALNWLRENPDRFNPSVAKVGLTGLGAETEKETPHWAGLVCVHAQEQGEVGIWEKFGFEVDKEMGRWREEGIWYVGMFQRLQFVDK